MKLSNKAKTSQSKLTDLRLKINNIAIKVKELSTIAKVGLAATLASASIAGVMTYNSYINDSYVTDKIEGKHNIVDNMKNHPTQPQLDENFLEAIKQYQGNNNSKIDNTSPNNNQTLQIPVKPVENVEKVIPNILPEQIIPPVISAKEEPLTASIQYLTEEINGKTILKKGEYDLQIQTNRPIKGLLLVDIDAPDKENDDYQRATKIDDNTFVLKRYINNSNLNGKEQEKIKLSEIDNGVRKEIKVLNPEDAAYIDTVKSKIDVEFYKDGDLNYKVGDREEICPGNNCYMKIISDEELGKLEISIDKEEIEKSLIDNLKDNVFVTEFKAGDKQFEVYISAEDLAGNKTDKTTESPLIYKPSYDSGGSHHTNPTTPPAVDPAPPMGGNSGGEDSNGNTPVVTPAVDTPSPGGNSGGADDNGSPSTPAIDNTPTMGGDSGGADDNGAPAAPSIDSAPAAMGGDSGGSDENGSPTGYIKQNNRGGFYTLASKIKKYWNAEYSIYDQKNIFV